MALRMLGTFWLVMSAAGLATEYLFRGVGDTLRWDYATVLDIVALAAFAGLYLLFRRRDSLGGGSGYFKDPVCGMQVEIAHAPAVRTDAGRPVYFCSDHCAEHFAGHPA